MPLAIRKQRRDDRMEKMNVIQRLAPNYWLGYYVVYMATLLFLRAIASCRFWNIQRH